MNCGLWGRVDVSKRVFEFWTDFTHARGSGIELSEGTVRRTPRPDAQTYYWKLHTHATYDADHRMTQETRDRLSELWVLTKAGSADPMDLIGVDERRDGPDCMVSTRLAEAIAEMAGEAVEFMQVPRIWSVTEQKELTEPKYHYMNVIARHDSWDDSQTCIVESHDRKTGRPLGMYRIERSKHIVKDFDLPNFPIWRDSRTLHMMCTEVMKDLLESFDINGLRFRPVDPIGVATAGDWMAPRLRNAKGTSANRQIH